MDYEEAKERIKARLNYLALDDEDLEAMKVLIPELRESEDERIRKVIRLALIATENELSVFYRTHNITCKECTDWLEKQKIVPVQTEKERIYIRTLQSLISDFLRDHDDQTNTEFYQGCWDWLEGRHIEQKPVEWSEKDESIINRLFIEISKYEYFAGIPTKDILNFFKSLRPEPHWKPSETQMAMLRAVLNDNDNMTSESANMALESLYNDLMKLK